MLDFPMGGTPQSDSRNIVTQVPLAGPATTFVPQASTRSIPITSASCAKTQASPLVWASFSTISSLPSMEARGRATWL